MILYIMLTFIKYYFRSLMYQVGNR